jgi:hypothetical protein
MEGAVKDNTQSVHYFAFPDASSMPWQLDFNVKRGKERKCGNTQYTKTKLVALVCEYTDYTDRATAACRQS